MFTILLLLQGLLVVFLAPLAVGWSKQLKAWLQNRAAPPLFQPYADLRKLFIKQPVVAKQASWLFLLAPYIYFSCMAALCFIVPFIWVTGLATIFVGVIVIAGVLVLARVFLVLAAMDIGTAFGSLGARREMFVASLAEPVLLLIFLNVTLLVGNTHLNMMGAYFLANPALYPSIVFSLLAFVLVMLAETGRIPIDNPATHLELTMIHEAMLLEYSGRYLALIEWGSAIKFLVYFLLLIVMFFPYGLSESLTLLMTILGLVSTVAKLIILIAIIAVIESLNAKMRIFKVPEYLAGAFMLAVLGILLTQLMGAGAY